jgi:hypothetical protein
MKKSFAILLVLIVVLFLSLGCTTQKSISSKAPKAPVIIGLEGQPQPEWVNLVPKVADVHYETGYAKLSNKANSIKRANADAKEKISQWINTQVQSVVVNYTSDFGAGDDRQAIEAYESISRQVSETSLMGVTQESVWVDQEGGVWVLLSMPKENTLKAFEAASQSFEQNDAAAYAQFKMNEALKMLESTLAKD